MVEVRNGEATSMMERRVRGFQQSIADAAVGHAATLYEARARNISAEVPEREGYHTRIVRTTRGRHEPCGGLGILYELDPVKVTILIRECTCVEYTVRYEKLLDPVRENRDAPHQISTIPPTRPIA